jgi:D-aminoacyl-tRNA deacylase
VRALLQRVHEASVTVAGDDGPEVAGRIGRGLVALVGVTHDDTGDEARRLADKIHRVRCFDDADGVMNLGADEVGAEVLVVSQFTLYGDTRKGRRPSWLAAAPPEQAEPLVEQVVARLRELGAEVATGRFRAHTEVALVNDGPVTLLLEV